jgi:hypothetical protein
MKKPILYNFDDIREKKQYWLSEINRAKYYLKEWEKKENELRRKYSELVIIKNNLQIPTENNKTNTSLDKNHKRYLEFFYNRIQNPCNMCKLENYNINSDLCNWCYEIIENENARHTKYIMEKYKNE